MTRNTNNIKPLPTLERLHEVFVYCSESGNLTWKYRGDVGPHVNGRWAGKQAGSKNTLGYWQVGICGTIYLSHRICWKMANGVDPANQIDHIDGDRSNNSIKNLRVVSNQGNQKNQKIYRNNTSGVMGVYWHKNMGKWFAMIRFEGKSIFLGYFPDIADAITARKKAEIKFGYHQNHGRT